MPGELFAGRKPEQCDVHILVLVQDAAEDSCFRQLKLLLQAGKEFIVHCLLLCGSICASAAQGAPSEASPAQGAPSEESRVMISRMDWPRADINSLHQQQ